MAPVKKERTETFGALKGRDGAEAFKLAVEDCNNHYPDGFTPGFGWGEPDDEKYLTLDQIAEKFFAHMYQRADIGKIDTYTVERYERAYLLHVSSVLGGRRFDTITRADIQDWIAQMVSEDWSAKSVKNWHSGMLSPMFTYAQIELNLRPDNPCRGVDLPPEDNSRELMFFQLDEWAQLRHHLADDVHLIFDFLTMSGARIGEVLALRKSDCTVQKDGDVSIRIQRAWHTRGKKERKVIKEAEYENKKWKLGPPKGGKARYIMIVGDVAERLVVVLDDKTPKDYVFTREGDRSTGCPWRYDDFHYERWRVARAAAETGGLNKEQCNPHMLRHTCVVWTFAQDPTIRIEDIAERLGHVTVGGITWNRYGGELNANNPRVARAMQSAMTRAVDEFATQLDGDEQPGESSAAA